MGSELPHSGSRKNDLQPSSIHRTSIEAQAGIGGLRSSSAIDRIPTEVLSHILDFAIQTSSPLCFCHGHRKEKLATVSRTWGSIIFSTPRFWRIINISPFWPLLSVKEHVERSHGCLLDIVIHDFWDTYPCPEKFTELLDIVAPHIERWRSVTVRCPNSDIFPLLLRKLGNSTLPRLVHIDVSGSRDADVRLVRLLRPETTPALERLRLNCGSFPDDGRGAPAVFTFSSQSFSQKLTTLSLVIFHHLSLRPDSIILPLLTSLSLYAAKPRRLIEAIVAPKLISFCYESGRFSSIKLSTVFDGLQSRFSSIQNLVLSSQYGYLEPPDAETVCLTFPNVRNVEMPIKYTSAVFGARKNNSSPADLWNQLQCLVIDSSRFSQERNGHQLKWWIKRRSVKDQPKLRIVFTNFPPERYGVFVDASTSPQSLYNSLREHCTIELMNVSMTVDVELTLRTNSVPQMVRIAA